MNAFQNWEYVDRLIEEPRLQLAQELIRANPLILADPFYVNRRDECFQFHKDLQERWKYDAPSEKVYTTLVDHIHNRTMEHNSEVLRNNALGEVGEMWTFLPQSISTADAFFHEIVYHAFTQGYLGDNWLDNLNLYFGCEKVRYFFSAIPSLYLLAPPAPTPGDGQFLPQVRRLCHSDICLLLKIMSADSYRLAFLGLSDETL